ncbi:MAG: hypothetical protein KBA36_08910, partial [Thermomonas sp.]|nr:hypothetical protein [Thermomonas sp.]
MATISVATTETISPEKHGAPPIKGNYTGDADMHLWCADALARIVGCPEMTFDQWHDDIQNAVQFLLSCETSRAMMAFKGENERQFAAHLGS